MTQNGAHIGSEGKEESGKSQCRMQTAVSAMLAASSFFLFWIHHLLCPFPEFDWDNGYVLHGARQLARGNGYTTFPIDPDGRSEALPIDMATTPCFWNGAWAPLKSVVIASAYKILGHFRIAILAWYLLCGLVSWLVFGYLVGKLVSPKWLALALAVLVPPYVSHVYAGFQSSEMMALPLFMLWGLSGWHLLHEEPKSRAFLLWSVAGALFAGLAVWARYSMLFMLPAHAVLLVICMAQRRSINWVAITASLVLMVTVVGGLFALNMWGDSVTHQSPQQELRPHDWAPSGIVLAKAVDHRPVTRLALGPAGITFLVKYASHRLGQLGASELSAWLWLLIVPALGVLGLFASAWWHRRKDLSLRRIVTLAWLGGLSVTAFVMAAWISGTCLHFRERYIFYGYPLLLLSFFAVWPTGRRAQDVIVKGCLCAMLISIAILAVRAHVSGVRNIVRHGLHICEHVPSPYREVIDQIEKTVREDGHPAIVFSDVGGALLAGTDHPVYRYPADNPNTSKQLHVFLVDFDRPGYKSDWWETPSVQRLRQRVDGEIIARGDWGLLWHGIMDADPGSQVDRENL